MRGEQKRSGIRRSSGKMRDDVSYIAADLLAGVVDEYRRAEIFHLALETHGYIALAARQAVDFYELDEQVIQTLVIDQNVDLAVDIGTLVEQAG